jgi:hypothetical protein
MKGPLSERKRPAEAGEHVVRGYKKDSLFNACCMQAHSSSCSSRNFQPRYNSNAWIVDYMIGQNTEHTCTGLLQNFKVKHSMHITLGYSTHLTRNTGNDQMRPLILRNDVWSHVGNSTIFANQIECRMACYMHTK